MKFSLKVVEALESLGETPEEVAESLAILKIKGERLAAFSCPIAKFLNKKFWWIPFWAVTGPRAGNFVLGIFMGMNIPTTTAVETFVYGFDTGSYPNLRKDYDH